MYIELYVIFLSASNRNLSIGELDFLLVHFSFFSFWLINQQYNACALE